MADRTTIECDITPAVNLLKKVNAAALPTLLEAASAGVRSAAISHFRDRNAIPARSAGFPRFGATWPKSNFWSGVAKSVGAVSVQGDTATIAIDSPALAHKANPNPPLITPKGGRKYLAIPANARSSAFPGMPRDWLGGDMHFGYAPTPDGALLPALLASRAKGTPGPGDVQYWLVRQVQTQHDPDAMPATRTLATAATRAAQTALNQLLT